MKKKNYISFSKHAYDQFQKNSLLLGLNSSPKVMKKLFHKAVIEKNKNPYSKFELFKRNILHGKTKYYVINGWRFVVANNRVVTIERVKAHENYKYAKNWR